MEPKHIRQNEIDTAGTLSRYRAMIGEVLTESIAIKRRKYIFSFTLINPLLPKAV